MNIVPIKQTCFTENACTIMSKFGKMFNECYLGITNDLFPFEKLYDTKFQVLIEVAPDDYCSLGGCDSLDEGNAIVKDIISNIETFKRYGMASVWCNPNNYLVASTDTLKENYFDVFGCENKPQEPDK